MSRYILKMKQLEKQQIKYWGKYFNTSDRQQSRNCLMLEKTYKSLRKQITTQLKNKQKTQKMPKSNTKRHEKIFNFTNTQRIQIKMTALFFIMKLAEI